MIVLGLDTSCYTTSIAAVSAEGRLLVQQRRLVSVPEGKRGARQSEALFQHVQTLPALTEALFAKIQGLPVSAVAASFSPRTTENSYMPVFTVGAGAARQIAAALHVPLFPLSHQQGHVCAALYESPWKIEDTFLALHLSGGTTEVLLWEGGNVECLGGSEDLHAGQFVDRIGVALGLPFPAGPNMEKLAASLAPGSLLPASVRGLSCSFSGAETAAQKLAAQGTPPEIVAAEVYGCLGRSIAKLIAAAVKETGIKRVLLSGGVAASENIRRQLTLKWHKLYPDAQLAFGKPEFCGDNAVGCALWGAYQLKGVL